MVALSDDDLDTGRQAVKLVTAHSHGLRSGRARIEHIAANENGIGAVGVSIVNDLAQSVVGLKPGCVGAATRVPATDS